MISVEIHFEPVNSQNREQLLRLRVAPGQEGFIETVAECLEEAAQEPCWRPVAIYDADALIGFAMYCRWQERREGVEYDRVWLDRLLVDASCQGKGYGKTCVPLLLDRLKEEYGPREVYLSVYPENQVAARLYEEFGFRFNGERDLHGEQVMVRPA